MAILGASPRPHAVGNTVVKNLVKRGYGGGVFPIHPTASEVLGLRCFTGLRALPERPDCVAVAISYDKVMSVLEEMVELGIPSAVLFASGFAETGEAGVALQSRMSAFCRENAIELCGPNCLGLYSAATNASIYSASLPEALRPGPLAVLSHSGSACIALSNLGRFGFSHLVSAGNGAVTDLADYLDFIAEDDQTRVVAMFVETVRDPAKFAAAADKARRAGKAVVALKVGRSSAGAAASAAHTGAIAGSDAALVSLFKRSGVALVEDYDEFVETSAIFLGSERRVRGSGVGVVNVSGGELALTCDLAERVGIDLPSLSTETLERLKKALPPFANPRNPLDATGVAVFDPEMYKSCVATLASDPAVSLIAISQDCPASLGADQASTYAKLAHAVAAASREIDKPLVFFNNLGCPIHPGILEALEGTGVPALTGMRNGLRAIKHLMDRDADLVTPTSGPVEEIAALPRWVARLSDGNPLTEREGKAFLADHGIVVTREVLAATADEAAGKAAQIGFPVVLKVESADLPHKSEVGGVMLGLKDEAEVREGFDAVMARVRAAEPRAKISGILVQEMIGGVEAIVGAITHDPYGPGVVVGPGGVLVELLQDAAFELAPITRAQSARMIASTRLDTLLKGFRGQPPADRTALIDVLTKLSQVALAYVGEIEAIDLNPVCVRADGQGAVVLDALVIPRPNGRKA